MAARKTFFLLVAILCIAADCFSQHDHAHMENVIPVVEPQPLLAQAARLSEALSFLGSPLSAKDEQQLRALQRSPLSQETVRRIQSILDPYCLATVSINPEARVKVQRGAAPAKLMEDGWTTFLVKVINDASINAQLQVYSENALSPVHSPSFEPRVKKEDSISPGQSQNRFLDVEMYRNKPLLPNLSGLRIEYQVVQLYSKDAGQREADISFSVGQGTQDVGFRSVINILFQISHPVTVRLHIKDEDGSPTMAALSITDGIDRSPGRLNNYYPLPSRRVAAFDQYPDFFFQKQIYRADGETVQLPSGKYHVTCTRGPEYLVQEKDIVVPAGTDTSSVSVVMKRWINMAKRGWYSADHHVHGAGCSHYDSPEEGVPPASMIRQSLGEDLNIAAVLSWGPGWYHQKSYFTGKDDVHSEQHNILHYDVEVSGFPSSHAGHVVLLRLKEDDYPGTSVIEQWPSWTLPVLQWAKAQGGITGYAHSGWGLEPITPVSDLFNDVVPKMDGIGANEYVVTVTQKAVDFYSLGDTPLQWELNMWYHTLNCGFRTKASGETDFPCITDQRVGLSRTYFKSDGAVNYDSYVSALRLGRSYVSEGGAHLMDFAVNKQEVGSNGSELQLQGAQTVQVSANVAAYLPLALPDSASVSGAGSNVYWSIEKARRGSTRKVTLELIANGRPVDSSIIVADGNVNAVHFTFRAERSCWLAIRILPSAHSNPIFLTIDGKPIKEKQSAEWCRKAVDQCWKMKSPNIRQEERPQAQAAYNSARAIYDAIINAQ